MPVGRPFPKGASGNPGGRPAIPVDVVALAKTHTPLAIATLAKVCEGKASAAAKVAAAVALLDRAWGRPVQPTENRNLNLNVNAYSDAELLAIVSRARGAVAMLAGADSVAADTIAAGPVGVAGDGPCPIGVPADSVGTDRGAAG